MAFTKVTLFSSFSPRLHKNYASNNVHRPFNTPRKRIFGIHGIKSCTSLENTAPVTTKPQPKSNAVVTTSPTIPPDVHHANEPENFESEWDDGVFALSSQEAQSIVELLKCESKKRSKRKDDNTESETETITIRDAAEQVIEVGDVSVQLGAEHTSVRFDLDKQIVEILGVTVSKATLEYMTSREGAWLIFPDGSYSRAARHGQFASVSLRPVPNSFPTVIIGGFGMHRFARDVRPCTDTANKIRAAKPRGRVLDICTGLGYTAIAAASTPNVRSVLTIEKDESVLEMTKVNPWSRALYTTPSIEIKLGDAIDILRALPDEPKFDTICHDPPALAYGGDLYSGAFYAQLRRLLSHNGRLFHYIGNPNSEESGRLFKGVKKRLLEAGFAHVQCVEDAFGVVAVLQTPRSTRSVQKSNRTRRKK